ncbi:MAG: leucine-rich repeat domain-containing protein [Planctomycetaceae bacterium]
MSHPRGRSAGESSNGGAAPPSAVPWSLRHFRFLTAAVVLLILAGAGLGVSRWSQQRAVLFDGAYAHFARPEWDWLDAFYSLTGTEHWAAPIRLEVIRRPLAPHEAALIGTFNQLEQLKVTRLTDEDLEPLGRLSNLTHLDMSNSKTTEAGWRPLAGMRSLTHLKIDAHYLNAHHLNDASLESLAQLTNLKELRLGVSSREQGSLSDAGLRHLSKLPSFEVLGFHNVRFVGDPFRSLAASGSLRTLDLYDCDLTDDMLISLERLKTLQSVSLRGTPVSRDACVRLLTAHPNIAFSSDHGYLPRPTGQP